MRLIQVLSQSAGTPIENELRYSPAQRIMITFQISGYLIEFTGGRAEIRVDAAPETVNAALNELWSRHIGLRDRVLTEQGQVRPHVNIFVDSQIVRRDQVLQTPVSAGSEICIMPAVSGG